MTLRFSKPGSAHHPTLSALVATTFAASEGAEEGAMVGGLAARLLATTPPKDLHAFCAWDGPDMIAASIFSRLSYADDPCDVFILSPMAVAAARQKQGIGQQLILHGLAQLRAVGAAVAVTYGDPAFYGRTGFVAVAPDDLAAPFALQFPHGWVAQSLTPAPLPKLAGPVSCVPALNDPGYW
ncbi:MULTISPECIES: N-acetyltransferase [unclassified Yoonia]|uniref:GNAT family N-acetyltransferase n=1 Tax=unclassified Yoonia TaxID=2629118 RepID=UPI002AFEF43E|nr:MULTISPECIES: N-acetyltransferase [unclassified Yoonia]